MVLPPVVITSVNGLVVMARPPTAVPLKVADEAPVAVPVPVAVPPVAVAEADARASGARQYSTLSVDNVWTYSRSMLCRKR